METLFSNKRFIMVSTGFMVVLSVFVFTLFLNEVKSSEYIGSDKQQVSTINVAGAGDVSAVPDIAVITLTLSKDAKTSNEAQKKLNESLTQVLAYLDTQKIDKKDVKSEYGGVNPKYDYVYDNDTVCGSLTCRRPGKQVISGYTANQNITVKVRAVDTSNDVLTGLTKLGIQNINGPTFSIDDETKLKEQARGLAIYDAQQKARVLAKQLGVKLVRITSFSENSGGYPIMYAKSMMAMDSAGGIAPAPELPKGENKISSNVNITYEIR